MSKQYRALIDGFVEKGVVHAKGRTLQVEIADDRAANLINAGYIEEVLPEAPKAETKEFEAPQNKIIEKNDAETKSATTATGFAANLKNRKKTK